MRLYYICVIFVFFISLKKYFYFYKSFKKNKMRKRQDLKSYHLEIAVLTPSVNLVRTCVYTHTFTPMGSYQLHSRCFVPAQ